MSEFSQVGCKDCQNGDWHIFYNGKDFQVRCAKCHQVSNIKIQEKADNEVLK